MNLCIYKGNVATNVTYVKTDNGTKIARYSLAVDGYKGETTYFIRLVSFGKRAEFARDYIKKGQSILVRCSYSDHEYTNKDGQKVRSVEFVVDNTEFCGGKRTKTVSVESTPISVKELPDDFSPILDDKDLPFK